MDWKRIAPWNWFRNEEAASTPRRLPGFGAPSDPFAALRAEMDRVFDEAVRRSFPQMAWPAAARPVPLRPVVDIAEGRKAYTIRVELPGIAPEDVSLEVDDRTLVLRAEKRHTKEEDEEGYHCIERSYGSLQRVLSLPDDADGDAIEASFERGVLKLRIPKSPERTAHKRSIAIKEA